MAEFGSKPWHEEAEELLKQLDRVFNSGHLLRVASQPRAVVPVPHIDDEVREVGWLETKKPGCIEVTENRGLEIQRKSSKEIQAGRRFG